MIGSHLHIFCGGSTKGLDLCEHGKRSAYMPRVLMCLIDGMFVIKTKGIGCEKGSS